MKRPRLVALMVVFSVMTLIVLAFGGDRSCTSVMQMVLDRRLSAAATSNSMTDQQLKQFSQAAQSLNQERLVTYQQSADNDKKYQEMVNSQSKQIFEENPQLAQSLMKEAMERHKELGNKVAQAIAGEYPDLVRQAREGDQQAKNRFMELVNRRVLDDSAFQDDFYRAEQRSSEFQTKLQESLHRNSEFQAMAAREIDDNARLTRIEARQQTLAKETAPPDYDRAVAATARQVAESEMAHNREYGQLMEKSQAAQDLLTTWAGSEGALQNLPSERITTALVGRRFDSYEPGVAAALVDARSFNSASQGQVVGAQLVLTHIADQEKSTTARAALMKDPPNQLSRSLAENTSKALRPFNNDFVKKSIYKGVPTPTPPDNPTPEQTQSWSQQMAQQLVKATEKAKGWTIEIGKSKNPE